VGRKYAAKRRETDSELLNARTRAWCAKQMESNPNYYSDRYWANPESARRARRKHYSENTEKCLVAQKLWRKNNPETAKQSAKNWKLNHPEENRQISMGVTSRYRAKKKLATIQNFSHQELMQRMSVFGFQCAYCSGPFEEIDHLIPLSKGGKHCLSNLRPSCKPCNNKKSNKMPAVWFEELRKRR
jgi:5-methylcytosine-specific restriction endonuclease McrA